MVLGYCHVQADLAEYVIEDLHFVGSGRQFAKSGAEGILLIEIVRVLSEDDVCEGLVRPMLGGVERYVDHAVVLLQRC
jgi:hypothetical protein